MFFWTLKHLSFVLGILCLILGLGLILAGPALIFGMDFFDTEALQELKGDAMDELKMVLRAYGIIAVLVAPFFFVIRWLSELILERNRYIDAVEVAIEEARPKDLDDDSDTSAKDAVNYK